MGFFQLFKKSSKEELSPDVNAYTERKNQIIELYGVPFPSDFYALWDWYSALSEEMKNTFCNTLGMRLNGAFDVLAGKFDNIELRYPALLHWRFYLDPPEFFTVISGDSDGLHWGYWFDDPEKEKPVTAAWYARDAFDLWYTGDTLFNAVINHINETINNKRENIEYEPEYRDSSQRDIENLITLRNSIPKYPGNPKLRKITAHTPEGMGISAPKANSETIAKFKRGKELWFNGDKKSLDLLEEVYTALDRKPLANVIKALRDNPHLPKVDILEYRIGDYNSFSDALKEPTLVRKLEIGNKELTELPDMSQFVNLEELILWGNSLEKLPHSLLHCSGLKRINLFRNNFSEIPQLLSGITGLEEINLGKNRITTAVDSLKEFQESMKITLFDNIISDEEKDVIKTNFPHLKITL